MACGALRDAVRLGRATVRNGKGCFQGSLCSMRIQQRLETSKLWWHRPAPLWIHVQRLGAEEGLVGRGAWRSAERQRISRLGTKRSAGRTKKEDRVASRELVAWETRERACD